MMTARYALESFFALPQFRGLGTWTALHNF